MKLLMNEILEIIKEECAHIQFWKSSTTVSRLSRQNFNSITAPYKSPKFCD